jgi:hypothetical protein
VCLYKQEEIMSHTKLEMQAVENLLKAINEGEDKIENLRLSSDELDRYSGCLLASGMATLAHNDTGKRFLNPTAAGNALLTIIRDLETITRECKFSSILPGHDSRLYQLEDSDIDRIQNRLTN